MERIFILQETGEATNYFTAQPMDASLEIDPADLSQVTFSYTSPTMSQEHEYLLTETEAGSEVYVDDTEEPTVQLTMDYLSSLSDDDVDGVLVTLNAPDASLQLALHEVAADANIFTSSQRGERAEMTPMTPGPTLFQIVSYDPQGEETVIAQVDAGAGFQDVQLTLGPDGLHRSRPQLGVPPGATGLPQVVESGYYGTMNVVFGAKDAENDYIVKRDGLSEYEVTYFKGGLIVMGDPRGQDMYDTDFFPEVSHMGAIWRDLYLKRDNRYEWNMMRHMSLNYVRVLVFPTSDEVGDALENTSHFLINGHSKRIPGTICNQPDYGIEGIYLGWDSANKRHYLNSSHLEGRGLDLKVALMNSCKSGKTADTPDDWVSSMVEALNADFYIGWQAYTVSPNNYDYMDYLILEWPKNNIPTTEMLQNGINGYLKKSNMQYWPKYQWGIWVLYTNGSVVNPIANCNIENHPWDDGFCVYTNRYIIWTPDNKDYCSSYPQ